MGFSSNLRSQPPTTIRLADAVRQIVDGAPELRELKTQTSLAEDDVWRRFLPNEPMFTFEKDDSDSSQSFGLAMTFGFPGKAFAYSKLDAALLRRQQLEFAAKQHELISLITHAYIDCAAAQETVGIRERTVSELDGFLSSLRARRGVTQTEKLSFEIETRLARQDLAKTRDEQEVSCRKFAAYDTSVQATPVQLALPDDLEDTVARNFSPETSDESRNRAALEMSAANYDVARWSQMPDFTISMSRKQPLNSSETDSRPWANVYGVGVTIPILYPFHEAAEVRRAKSLAELERSEAKTLKVQLNSDRLEAARRYRRNRDYLKQLRTKDLSLAQALLESSYAAYRAGQIGYAEMVFARRTLVELRLRDIELRTQIIDARLKCLDRCETGEPQ